MFVKNAAKKSEVKLEFTYLAAGFNGIEAGDKDDLDIIVCPECDDIK